jgi:ribosomal protein S18 acetylase RimI-like enzyme
MNNERQEDPEGGAEPARRAVSIRRAAPGDFALLAQLGERTFRETFEEFNRPEDMSSFLAATYTPERQAKELLDPRLWYFVSEVGAEAVAFALLRSGTVEIGVSGEDPIELARIYVVRAALGEGVGSALMRFCLEEARRMGRRTIWLGVWEHNERALAFYRRWGFVDVGSHVFQVGTDPQIDRVMMRAL